MPGRQILPTSKAMTGWTVSAAEGGPTGQGREGREASMLAVHAALGSRPCSGDWNKPHGDAGAP